jgi:hypothetical protein
MEEIRLADSSGAKALKNHRCELIFFACDHQVTSSQSLTFFSFMQKMI